LFQARKARRISTNRREAVLLRSLSATHKFKETWRSVLEEAWPLWGDLRSSTTKHFNDTLIYNSSTSIVSGKVDREEADHSWKCIWSSILEFGLAMENAASDPTQDRPTFTEVFQFLKQTSQLLTPSQYRRSLINNLDAHNLSKEAMNNEEFEDIEGRLSMCCSKLVAHMERARDFRAWLLDYVADNEEGVDLDILREALNESIPNSCPLVYQKNSSLTNRAEQYPIGRPRSTPFCQRLNQTATKTFPITLFHQKRIFLHLQYL
jgi:hypothetical protein